MYRNKLTIFIIIILTVITVGLFSFKTLAEKYRNKHCIITQLSCRLLDLNTIKVNVASDLNINDFKIKNLNSGKIVFENGITYKKMKNEYGHFRFEIYYKDTLIYELNHFKTNNWNTYDYMFVIKKNQDTVNVTLTKKGPEYGKEYGQVFYKQFVRNNSGKIVKIKYIDYQKKTLREEIIK